MNKTTTKNVFENQKGICRSVFIQFAVAFHSLSAFFKPVLKKRKSITSCFLIAAMILSFIPFSVNAAETTNNSSMCLESSQITQYSTVYYGNEISWLVLDPTKTNTNETGMLVISEHLMENIAFDSDLKTNNSLQQSVNEWQYSDAQEWCKGFANETNFSSRELAVMRSVSKTDTDYHYFDSSVYFGTSVLENEKMFYLSALEAVQYFSPLSLGIPANTADDTFFVWWLRSPVLGESDTTGEKYAPKVGAYSINMSDLSVRKVNQTGEVSYGFGSYSRPAFNLSTYDIVFSSDAINDKAPISASGNGELSSVSVGTPSSWKFTLYDSLRRFFLVSTDSITTASGETKTITYSNAVVGTNDYVSAMIVDKNDEILYYGKLELAESGTDNTAKIEIPSSIPNGNYTIKVFNERCNGAKTSDLSSQLQDIPLTVSNEPVLENGIYQLSCAKHLVWFATQVNENGNTGINGKMVNDIDLGNVEFSSIGTQGNPYTGTFDGGGFKISNLSITGDYFQGFIGCVSGNAEIKNVIIESGSVTGIAFVGGIVGGSAGSGCITIENCSNAAQIKATGIGSNQTTRGENAAGIFGCNYGSNAVISIISCGNTGAVTGLKESAAIAGWLGNNGAILSCYNTGTVSGYTSGNAFYRTGNSETLNYNYNLDSVGNDTRIPTKSAEQFASGEVCYLLNNSISSEGAVWCQNIDIGTTDSLPVLDDTHGVVYYGYVNCIVTEKSYTNNPVSQTQGALHSYDDKGFCIHCGDRQPASLKDGVYQIGNAGQLYWFSELVNGTLTDGTTQNMAANAVLTADITITGTAYDFTPIGCGTIYDSICYKGIFDGDGHSIAGLKGAYYVSAIQSWSQEYAYFGLFGDINGGTVKNLNVSAEIIGYFTTGILCGTNKGTIENCSVTGSLLTGGGAVGLICGENESSGTVKNCFVTEVSASSQGTTMISNITGRNSGTITNCYYRAASETDSISGTTFKTAAQFASGEVCWLLNSGTTDGTQVWYQRIGIDALPKFSGGTVYPAYGYDSNGFLTTSGYSNTSAAEPSSCYQSATLNSDGYYEISNAGQLCWFAARVNGGSTGINGILTANIDLNGVSWTPIGVRTDADADGYAGIFNGGGYAVSNFSYTASGSYAGFFGMIYGGTVKNLTVTGNMTVNGGSNVGLIGCITAADGDTAYVINVTSNIAITITSAGTNIGGIAGYMCHTKVTGCTNNGDISSADGVTVAHIGGITGSMKGDSSTACASTVEFCQNCGDITAYDSNDCFGGIVGYTGYITTAGTTVITDCFNSGSITVYNASAPFVGGILGYVNDSNFDCLINCRNTGTIAASGSYVGGIIGRAKNLTASGVTNNYYLSDASTSGIGTGSGTATAKTAAQFASGEVCWLLNSGKTDGTQAWYQTLGTDTSPVFSGGTVYAVYAYDDNGFVGTVTGYSNTVQSQYEAATLNSDGYYEISNAGQLYWFAAQVNGGSNRINGILTANIVINENVLQADGTLAEDTSGFRTWTPIGSVNGNYCGTFDGDGYTVSGIYTNSNLEYQGLFGVVCDGMLKNIGVVDSYITGSDFIGGVCGENFGDTITNCYNTGIVSGSYNYIGGVCGHNTGTITSCYNTGTVSDTARSFGLVGGVCGSNTGTITNCCNIGTISGPDNIGGVCGSDIGTITNCYYLTGCAKDGNSVTQYGIGCDTQGSATADTDGVTAGKASEQFASGEVCYLLNGGTTDGTQAFYQTLGTDACPKFVGLTVSYSEDAVPPYYNGTGSEGFSVGGTVTSGGSATDAVIIKFIKAGSDEPEYQTALYGNSAVYSLPNIEAGDYTVQVIKNNNTVHTYKLTVGDAAVTLDLQLRLSGDVNADGTVDSDDLEAVTGYSLMLYNCSDLYYAADFNNDGVVDALDAMFMDLCVNGRLDSQLSQLGDVNKDGNVDDADFNAVVGCSTSLYNDAYSYSVADVNGDGVVDALDVMIMELRVSGH